MIDITGHEKLVASLVVVALSGESSQCLEDREYYPLAAPFQRIPPTDLTSQHVFAKGLVMLSVEAVVAGWAESGHEQSTIVIMCEPLASGITHTNEPFRIGVMLTLYALSGRGNALAIPGTFCGMIALFWPRHRTRFAVLPINCSTTDHPSSWLGLRGRGLCWLL